MPAECIRSRTLRGECARRRGRTGKIGMPCTHAIRNSKRCTKRRVTTMWENPMIRWETRESAMREHGRAQLIPTLMCVWCGKTTTLWQFGPPVRRSHVACELWRDLPCFSGGGKADTNRNANGSSGRVWLQPDPDGQKCQTTGSHVQNRGYWAASGENSGPDRQG